MDNLNNESPIPIIQEGDAILPEVQPTAPYEVTPAPDPEELVS